MDCRSNYDTNFQCNIVLVVQASNNLFNTKREKYYLMVKIEQLYLWILNDKNLKVQ